ncbi:hydroxyacid dehydrogenase [Peptostreptococcaceae bacterium AGR-M142]
MQKILIVERIDENAIEGLKKDFLVDIRYDLEKEELYEMIKDYDGLIIRSITKVNKELLNRATNLKIIGRAGNGVDNIDIEECSKRGIIVCNTPTSNTISACELTIAMMINLNRNVSLANTDLKAGNFRRNLFIGNELYKKTLGIIGLGRIGSLVATRMQAFGMDVIAYDPYIKDEKFDNLNVKKIDNLNDLLKKADIITLHTPKTKETLNMISFDEFKIMKEDSIIINVARGGIIDEKALLNALKKKRIKGAGLDVFEVEPCLDNPLFEYDNVLVTPHMGASTKEAQIRVGQNVCTQVRCGLFGFEVNNILNKELLMKNKLQKAKIIKNYDLNLKNEGALK